MKAKFKLSENTINACYDLSDNSMSAKFNVPSNIGTKDYNHLYNKPSINGYELQGNVTLSDIGAMPNTTVIPTDTNQLTNGAGFVTNVVNDLTNYYLKSETYTKLEVQQLIASIPRFTVQVVQTLPETGEAMTLYLVPKGGEAPDVYEEYLWVTNTYELLGTTAVDLDSYATKTWVQNQGYQTNAVEAVTVNGTNYPITAITQTLVSGVSGVLVDYDDGNSGQMFFADGVGLNTVKTVIESTIPHDTSELTNGAGFLTIGDLPIYDGGVQ